MQYAVNLRCTLPLFMFLDKASERPEQSSSDEEEKEEEPPTSSETASGSNQLRVWQPTMTRVGL
jgi:hypothetical protein